MFIYIFYLDITKRRDVGRKRVWVGELFFERDLIRKHVLTCNGMLTVIEV